MVVQDLDIFFIEIEFPFEREEEIKNKLNSMKGKRLSYTLQFDFFHDCVHVSTFDTEEEAEVIEDIICESLGL